MKRLIEMLGRAQELAAQVLLGDEIELPKEFV